jgi:fibronectin-binding autotransporter adhesin
MSGTGSLTVQSSPGLTLTGTNSYSGGTLIQGKLSVAGDANLGVAAGSLTFDLGTLRSLGSFASTRAITINAQGGVFDTNGFTSTQNGAIAGIGGLTKIGDGTLVLTGTNTYSGGTTVSAGTLSGTTTSLQGNIGNSGQVIFDQTTTGTYAGVISGTGSFVKNGSGTVILTGANNYTGSTTISDGTLQGDTTSLHGAIANNANLAFNQTSIGTYTSVITGTGSLTKTGAGTLILSATNSYGGGTTVSAGVLQGNVSGVQGNITNNAAVVFDQGGSFGNYLGSMTGSGSLTVASGQIFLGGTNSYAGGTTVNSGTSLGGTTASLQGNIVNNGDILSFEQSTDGTFSGTISGSGAFLKTGVGSRARTASPAA